MNPYDNTGLDTLSGNSSGEVATILPYASRFSHYEEPKISKLDSGIIKALQSDLLIASLKLHIMESFFQSI
jgi:hypothetical protein